MSTYLDLLNGVAHVVGGTQPDPTGNPYWFSGNDKGDGTGVAGLAGCFSLPPENLQATPIAMVLPDSWRPLQEHPTQGRKYSEEAIHVRVLTGNADLTSEMATLVGFRDIVPAAFDTHMQMFGVANVLTADCSRGRFLEVEWGGSAYLALEFVVHVQRIIPVTYSA